MARPGRALLSRALVLGVLAVAAVATAAAVRDGSGPSAAVTTEAQEPYRGEQLTDGGLGALPAARALPGRLVILDAASCRPRVIDLARLELGPPGPRTGCRAWFDSQGRYGAVSLPGRNGTWLLDVAGGSIGEQVSGSSEPVAFADDGSELAQCRADGSTSVLDLRGGPDRSVAGCRPAFAPDGSVLTRPAVRLPTSVLRDGSQILGFDQLEGALPPRPAGAISVIGYDQGADGLLAVLVARFPGREQEQDYAPEVRPRLTLELWRNGVLERALPIRNVTTGFGSRVELSPSGSQALVTSSRPGVLVVTDLDSHGEPALEAQQLGVAWSPDGNWVAVATPDRIEIRTGATLELAYELPLSVLALAWAGPAGH